MTSLTRSSITGLYHPKRSLDSIGSSSSSSLTDNQSTVSSKRMNTSAIDRILHADKSGFLPTDSLSYSSRSFSNLDLSNSSSSSLERSILEAQIKRANSCNETMEASIKRLRTEAQNSTEDLLNKNESLEHSLHESRIKISELEHLLDKTKQQSITSLDTTTTPISIYQQQIKTLENDKLELKLQLQQFQHLHSKEVTQLEQSTNNLKHQLIDAENKLKLSQFEQEKLNSINLNNSSQLNETNEQLEHSQKRVIELELILSTLNPTNVINQSLLDDIKQISDIRYKNEQLKKEIELLKLKCNERIFHDEETRMLRKQAGKSSDYLALIAKHEAEILKLREQLANEKNKIESI